MASSVELDPVPAITGTRFFVAYTQYRDSGNPNKREGAVRLFTQLVTKAIGPLFESRGSEA